MLEYKLIISLLGWVRGNTKAFVGQKSISFDGHTHSYAAVSHTHDASQIVSGTLPVNRGGTGATSIDELKNLLGISSDNQYKVMYGTSLSTERGFGTVQFSSNFSTTPIILLTAYAPYFIGIYHAVVVSISVASTDSFSYFSRVIYSDNSGSGDAQVQVCWVALGP